MGKTLYLECHSGISGDMTTAALLDLGVDQEVLKKALKSLPLDGYEIKISRVKKAGLDVCDFLVKLDEAHENHDHDMDYLYGHLHDHHHDGHEHGHSHDEHEQDHSHQEHEHDHHHHHHHHHHEHRGLKEINDILENSGLTPRAKDIAKDIFLVLGEAEAKAHGVPIEEVHFHEVGAVDSIVDIAAAAVCLDQLDITEVIVPFISEGRGTVRCQHGILPVPVPAVANIIEKKGLPIRITERQGELVTPTGAAIVGALATSFTLPEEFKIRKTGIGAGKRKYDPPSLLRAMIIEPTGSDTGDFIYKLETDIDDCTGETLGYVMERLLEVGARDVHFVPIYMKKNRPAYELVVICDPDKREKLEQIIFEETTPIGIRRAKMERTVLPREMSSRQLPFGELKVKTCTLPDGSKKCYPEYDSAKALAKEKGITLEQVLEAFYKAK